MGIYVPGFGANRGEFTPPQQLLPIFYLPRRQNFAAELFCATRLNGPSCAQKFHATILMSSWAEKSEKAKNGYFSPFLAIFDLQTVFAWTETSFLKNAKHGRIVVGTFYPAAPMDFGF